MAESKVNSLKMSPRDILFIIFSKIHVLIGVFITVVVIVIVNTLRSTPVYQVSAAILIKPLVDSRLALQANRFAVAPISQEDVNTEIKLMLSKELMLRVIDKLNMPKTDINANDKKQSIMAKLKMEFEPSAQDKAISYIRSGLNVEPVSTSNMIQIQKKGTDPAEITKIVNTLLDCYIDRHIEAHKFVGSVDFYNMQILLYKQNIYELEEELKKFQRKWSIIDTEQQNIHNVKLLQLLRESLTYVRAQIAEKQTKVSLLKENIVEKGEITIMTEEFRKSEALIELLKGYVPLLVEKERIALLYPESSVEYKDMHSQTEQFRHEILKEQNQLLKGLEIDLTALINKKNVMESEIARIKAESKLLAEKEIDRDRMFRDIDQSKKNYQLYMDKLEEARITEQREISRVANVFVSNWATEPSTPVYPKMKLRLMIALLAGAIVGIGSTFGAYYLDQTVKRPEDMERISGVPVLSSLGRIK